MSARHSDRARDERVWAWLQQAHHTPQYINKLSPPHENKIRGEDTNGPYRRSEGGANCNRGFPAPPGAPTGDALRAHSLPNFTLPTVRLTWHSNGAFSKSSSHAQCQADPRFQ